ncbi:MAG: CBS domain-containing protein, partial [Usitatibacter sp.]
MKVDRIYTRNAIGISRGETLEEAAAAMRRFHVGSLLVFEKAERRQELVGIVTDRDLVVLSLAEGRDPRKVRVEEV